MASDFAVHVLDGGSMVVAREAIYGHQCDSEVVLPFPAYLIRHPKGNIVFDGGWQAEVSRDFVGYLGPEWEHFTPPSIAPEQHVLEQVKALDVDPADVEYAIISHLHVDHAGAVGHFPNATYMVHKDELAYAYDPPWFSAVFYARQDFDRGVEFQTLGLTEAEPELDLFGDGTVQVIFTPGHSIGHMSLAVALEDEPVLIAGDAATAQAHYDNEVMPGHFVDGPAVARSVTRLRAKEEAMGARHVFFGHSIEQFSTLKKGKEAYV